MIEMIDRKPRRAGSRRKTRAVLTTVAVDTVEWGPAMRALNKKQRDFVLALYRVKPGHGAQVRAAKLARYGTPTSSAESLATLASRLIHDEKIQLALREHDQKVLRAAAPRALRALHGLVEDPGHRDHARGIAMVLDRVHPVEQTHRIDIRAQHQHVITDPARVLARIREIAGRVGLDPDVMAPIDAEYEDITDDGGSNGST